MCIKMCDFIESPVLPRARMAHKIPEKLDSSWRMERAVIAHSKAEQATDIKNETQLISKDIEMRDADMTLEARVLKQAREDTYLKQEKQPAIVQKMMQDKAVSQASRPTPCRRPSTSRSSSGSY